MEHARENNIGWLSSWMQEVEAKIDYKKATRSS